LSTHTDRVYQIHEAVRARVEQVLPFGVFVRLPDGTRAYVRKRELTQAGNLDPRQVVSEGEEIEALVIALAELGRNLELSVRQAEPDPWDAFAQSVKVRDTLTAVVKRLSNRGALVQVVPGVDGFIPLSELAPWPVKRSDDLLWVGDDVEAMVTRLDRQARRVGFSIRQQMKHQARVREVMKFLSEKTGVEESLLDEDLESVEKRDEGIDSVIAERVGWVLVVDDHGEVREPLVEWLCQLGFVADGAGSLEQALACSQKRRYGLVLIDLDLSGKDGLSFIQTLEKAAPDTKVAVMSTPEWIARRSEELVALRVIDALVKPLNLDEIRELLIRLGQGETLGPLELSTSEHEKKVAIGSFERLEETVRSGLPLATRFEAGLKELVRFTRADDGLVFCLDPDSQQVSIVAQVGELALNREAIYALAESPVKDVIYEQSEVFETHVSRRGQRRFSNLLALLSFESCLGVPIPAGGKVQHALFLFHRASDAFSHYRLRDARSMAVLFSVALESQALEQRIRSVGPFLLSGHLAAGFGHEVYNKMSGLEIQLRNLQADSRRLEQRAECGQSPESCGFAEFGRAIDQLLDVALDLKSTVELFRELSQTGGESEVDVNEVVRRAALSLHPVAGQHQVRIDLDLSPDLPLIAGSTMRLQQVFVNLILNALQHTAQKMKRWPGDKGILQVVTSWEPEDERPVWVRFIDNGSGIHRRLWDAIFALGFSTRPGGTGLGLFIAKSLVESMGGVICVEQSLIPSGTTFRVELPTVMYEKQGAGER
jgi:signal transduction histidine kinase/predicted RNA-binding protein with RPS1 domain/ActR/RegA family two-component response regulator